MDPVPLILCGLDHPHLKEWHACLAGVSELLPVAHYDPHPPADRELLPAPLQRLPVYNDLERLLRDAPAEAALIMLPLSEAEKAMKTLAQAGLHIFAEKPVARTAGALQDVASHLAAGSVFYTGYLRRADPLMEQLSAVIRQGLLGKMWFMEMSWFTSRVGLREGVPAHRDPRSYLFRRELSRGGMLQWLGCHFIDLALYLAGEPPVSVAALTARQTTDAIEVEDTAGCLMRFGGGMLATLNVGYLLPTGDHQSLDVYGSSGWARWDSRESRRLVIHSEDSRWKNAPTRTYHFPYPQAATYGGGSGEMLLSDFARCIREGGARPTYTIEDAISVLSILDAAYASAAGECGKGQAPLSFPTGAR